MITQIQLLAIIVSLLLLGTTIELIRQRYLEEKYAISWLLACVFFLVCSINLKIVIFLSSFAGVILPSNFLFLLAFLFLIIVTLGLTVMVSNDSKRVRKLAQELSMVKFDMEELNKKLGRMFLNKEQERQEKIKNKEEEKA